MSQCNGIKVCGGRCRLKRKYSDFCNFHVDQNENCSICLNPVYKNITLECGHKFCQECIYTWMHKNPSCPNCRTEVSDQIILWKYVKDSIKNKLLIRMQEYSICTDQLNDDEIDELTFHGIQFEEYIYENDWNNLKLLLDKELLDKLQFEITTILVKVNYPYQWDHFKNNNSIFYFY
jgi:hypothetical protein